MEDAFPVIDLDFPPISRISLGTVQIEASRRYADGQMHESISKSTGFFYEKKSKLFVVTNWHNVTGMNPETGKAIGSFYPTHLSIYFKAFTSRSGDKGDVRGYTANFALFDADEKPTWIEHPRGEKIDVVALPVTIDIGISKIYPINFTDFERRWNPGISDDCFVVGYPEGLRGSANTPIWKRASIASEPRLEDKGTPLILIDTLGNSGMSGSPVIAKSSGFFNPSMDQKISEDAYWGSWMNFLGVYSGRLGDSGVSFQLGRVWKGRVIDEILRDE